MRIPILLTAPGLLFCARASAETTTLVYALPTGSSPVIAYIALDKGFFKAEGLDAELELIYPVQKCYEALRDGKADFVGGSSHSAPTAFPEWQGVKFLGALAQNTYWFLIMRADLNVKRGDVAAVKAATEAGKTAAQSLGEIVSVSVIARPHGDLVAVLPKAK